MSSDDQKLELLDVRRAVLRNYVRVVLIPQSDLLRKAMQDYEQFLSAELLLENTESALLRAVGLERLSQLDDAVNALISPDHVRRDFQAHERLSTTLYYALKPHAAARDFPSVVSSLIAIADAIRAKLTPNPVNISKLLADIGALLDSSITGVSMPKGG